MEVLSVSTLHPKQGRHALAGKVREEGRAEIQVIGAGALNQAVKAVAIVRFRGP